MGKKILKQHGDHCNCDACQHRKMREKIDAEIEDNRKTIERHDAERKLSLELYTTEEVVHALERIERLLEQLIRFEEKKETY